MIPYIFDGKFDRKTVMEICGAEALVRQAYKDSVGILTWGFGVTNKSGHRVERYRDAPATVQKCVEVYLWLLENYADEVVAEFKGFPIDLETFTGALSFQWNTGAIRSASWPDLFKAGKMQEARASFMAWKKPPEIIDRRTNEAKLIFDKKWAHSNGKVAEYTKVNPKTLSPVWSSRKMFDINPYL